MSRTRLLGIDYGRVRVGLAVSDPQRRLASPLATYARRDAEQDARYFHEVVEAEEIGGLVVGLPVHADGNEGPAAAEARQFGQWLYKVTGLPCVFWDERFTTVEAESVLWDAGLTHKKRKARRDQLAAQIVLQTYLDAGCPSDPRAGPLQG